MESQFYLAKLINTEFKRLWICERSIHHAFRPLEPSGIDKSQLPAVYRCPLTALWSVEPASIPIYYTIGSRFIVIEIEEN